MKKNVGSLLWGAKHIHGGLYKCLPITYTHTDMRLTRLWHLKSLGSRRNPVSIKLYSSPCFCSYGGLPEILHLVKEEFLNHGICQLTYIGSKRMGMLGDKSRYSFALYIDELQCFIFNFKAIQRTQDKFFKKVSQMEMVEISTSLD